MPEQLTKHPEVTLQVLQSGGARCASGTAPEILTRCRPNASASCRVAKSASTALPTRRA